MVNIKWWYFCVNFCGCWIKAIFSIGIRWTGIWNSFFRKSIQLFPCYFMCYNNIFDQSYLTRFLDKQFFWFDKSAPKMCCNRCKYLIKTDWFLCIHAIQWVVIENNINLCMSTRSTGIGKHANRVYIKDSKYLFACYYNFNIYIFIHIYEKSDLKTIIGVINNFNWVINWRCWIIIIKIDIR